MGCVTVWRTRQSPPSDRSKNIPRDKRSSLTYSTLHISLASRSTWSLVKEFFFRSTISWWMSLGLLASSSSSGLFTWAEIPTEKNLTFFVFSLSVYSFTISIPRELKPSVITTTALFMSVRRRVNKALVSPNSDENEISLYIITTFSNNQVMRIKKVSTKGKMSWYLDKFSLLVLQERYREQ